MEDYLKAIYELSPEGEKVSTSRLAERMRCTPASVTNMLQKLSGLYLADYAPYRGVSLTEAGTRIALEVVRHHRLVELYLAEVLGFSWDKVHDEADQLEHVVSEELAARLDKALGFPTKDPHGAPIPTRDGRIPGGARMTLWDAPTGKDFLVEQVEDKDPEVLRYLASLLIYPETRLKVVRRAPFNGPVFVLVEGKEHALSPELARLIQVRPPVDFSLSQSAS